MGLGWFILVNIWVFYVGGVGDFHRGFIMLNITALRN